MAKDPAFLFYYQDFAYGTRKMTFEEKGAYIELLCEQADTGHLSIDDIKRALGVNFPIWDSICNKFKVDEVGRYYNQVLESHIKSRQKYVKSRISNLKSTHMDSHMDSHMENVNVNENIIKKKGGVGGKGFRRPTLKQVEEYCKERNSIIDPELFWNHYESSGWIKANGQKVKNWKSTIVTWEKNNGRNKRSDEPVLQDAERDRRTALLDSLGEECS